jgi:hypothetical protein
LFLHTHFCNNILLFTKKNNHASIKERANAALASLQQNANAMNMLRSRLETRINFILNDKGKTEGYQELTRVLELVKNGQLILNVICERIESARYLHEFIMIIDNAALSISDMKNDIEQMLPAAEAALLEMHAAIAKVSTGLLPDLRQEIEPALLAEVSAAVAAEKPNTANVELKDATTTTMTSAAQEVEKEEKKEEEEEEEQHAQAESVLA